MALALEDEEVIEAIADQNFSRRKVLDLQHELLQLQPLGICKSDGLRSYEKRRYRLLNLIRSTCYYYITYYIISYNINDQ